jgi:SpoVK/Ycf46/Vps4 family AAA+-type ATPase
MDLGLLSKGDCVLKNSSDFVGAVIGEAAKTTRSIMEQAKGSVLVIDEAYNLSPSAGGGTNPYKADVIDTLVEQVQGVPGDDRVVIMLGYKEPMEAMFRSSNPGLARRFQMQNAFQFADYNKAELRHILLHQVKKTGLRVPDEALTIAMDILAREAQKPNFGNGGAVANLLSEAQVCRQNRLQEELTPLEIATDSTLAAADFRAASRQSMGQADEGDIFDGLVGMDDVVKQVRTIKAKLTLAKKIGGKAPVDTTFLFVGSPGTGKTTMARRMGRVFEELGILASAEVHETSASEFTTGYVGQAGGKTQEVMRAALGSVLFIDEAYRLNPAASANAFMQDVVDELVAGLTSEEFKGKMVVILAGYEKDIDEMLNVNQGLSSRFTQRIKFADFSPKDACTLLLMTLQREYASLTFSSELQRDVDRGAEGRVFKLVTALVAAPHFGNGRDVDTLAGSIFGVVAERLANDDVESLEFC